MEDPPRQLPDDVLADVLARLAPRSLAVSRCVCRDWSAVVDDRCRQLLRPDLLPLTVDGIFVQSSCLKATPDFFARSSTARSRRVAGRLESFVRTEDFGAYYIQIDDCCNGLLLLADDNLEEIVVANPATRRSVCLPRWDGVLYEDDGSSGRYWPYLAFDPIDASPHYEVISMQRYPTPFNPPSNGGEDNERLEELQWPPPVYFMPVYSSRTRRWEVRRIARDDGDDEGLHPRSITDGVTANGHSAYWRGVLYVHSNTHFILRINLSEDKYQVIDLPAEASASGKYEGLLHNYKGYLGKSKNGIYFAIINDTCQVLVWFLDESDGKVQWVFNHGINLYNLITLFWDSPATQTDNPWILQDDGDSHQEFKSGPTFGVEKNLKSLDWELDEDESAVDIKGYCDATVEEANNVHWDTDEEGAVDIEDYYDTEDVNEDVYEFFILGFHPYKEIVFLCSSRVVAYHFSTSKVQDLGELCLKYSENIGRRTYIYTPCWVGGLSENS